MEKYKALLSPSDLRDHKWSKIGKATGYFNWFTGFDIEKKLGFKLNPKHQNGSYSCGGQAGAMYLAIWDYFIKGDFTEKSAKDLYSQIAYPGGGTTLRDVMDLLKKKGGCLEKMIVSYENSRPPTEGFMLQRLQTPETIKNAAGASVLGYADVDIDMDSMAQAVAYNNGMIILIEGQNNGTWDSKFPVPPNNNEYIWRHFVYVGKAIMIGRKKYLGFINSEGDKTGENGWQYISEDYLPYVIEAKTMYDATDPIIKEELTKEQRSLISQILTKIQEILIIIGMQTKLKK